MPLFERSGSGEGEWVGPSRRRSGRKATPFKQRKATRDLLLLRILQDPVLKLSPREISDTLGIPLTTVRDALASAREKGRRHRASRPAPDDDEE
jgi:hypothetical protein